MGHARIGKITHKNVVPIRRGVPVHDDRRSAFLNHVAASYDDHALKNGGTPDAMVVVFSGVRQDTEAYWVVRGDSKGAGTSILCLAVAAIQKEIQK
jgi:hypothetical protein